MANWNPKFATGNVIRGLESILIGELILVHNKKASVVSGISDISAIDVRDLLGLSAFQSSMDALLIKFLNHTNSGGNWDGEGIIPNWTAVIMMTYLGETRLPAPATRDLLNDWIMQQYRMLNLLRWTALSMTIVNSSRETKYAYSSTHGSFDTIAEAITWANDTYAAQAFTSTGDVLGSTIASFWEFRYVTSAPSTRKYLTDKWNTRGKVEYSGASTAIDKSVDVYLKGITHPNAFTASPDNDTEYGNETSHFPIEDKFKLFETLSLNGLATQESSVVEQDEPTDVDTTFDPGASPLDSSYNIGVILDEATAVLKWDFEYKDWL
ncbi:MAG: hypothetical protein KAR42_14885 [candidate division Zixibacteria bacterium]|nr:hypothetical protein [candidate division Zixibacteria bacterium]